MKFDIEALAKREKETESLKRKADGQWRKAWWETTKALGQLENREQAVAIQTVADIIGQSPGYIRSRAKTGTAFRSYLDRDLSKIVPRMAIEVVSQGIDLDEQIIEKLITAEERGVSLRAFFQEITGKGWADTPAGASRDTIEQIVKAQPKLVGEIVASHPAASHAHDNESLATRNAGPRFQPQPGWDGRKHMLTRLTLAVKQLRQECDQPGELSENAQQTIEWAIAELTAIKEGRDFVGDIEAWLERTTA